MEESTMKSVYAEQYRQIGLKIAYYRKLRGLTQEELAEQVGLTPAYIGHLEAPNISKALSLDTLFDIAAALDVAPQKFLTFED
jgi:transcriptional regulator with XRE-family HTH domain